MSADLNKIIAKQLGIALLEERREKGLRLFSMQHRTGVPLDMIDRIELGKSIPPSAVKKLLKFYKKNIKLELID